MRSFKKMSASGFTRVPPALQAEFAVLLRRLALAILVSGLLFIAHLFYTGRAEPRNMVAVVMVLLAIIAYRDLAGARINRGFFMLVWGLWLTVCIFSFFIAGLRTPALLALPVLLVMTAWFQGAHAATAMVGLTTVVGVALAAAEYQGWLPPPAPRTAIDLLLVLTIVTVITSVVAVTMSSSFYRHYAAEEALATELRQRIDELNASEKALRELNEELEARVSQRTEEYQAANQSLREAMERLEQTQTELVQSEKLASLGSMVAGVSHELGTPLGNALLVSTTMQHHLDEIDTGLESGSLSKAQLRDSLGQAAEAARLMSRNVERAIGLVRSFKQTAVDQASQQRRSFDLAAVIDDTIASLRPQYKRAPWELRIDVAPGITLDSYPGPLEQIIINLVSNSVRHGFDGRERGCVIIAGQREGRDEILITVTDDGNGIAATDVGRVFDPFFTTKLGQGGSGVGLNIVHRIATTVLGGSITVRSALGQGTTFVLKIPQRAPHQD